MKYPDPRKNTYRISTAEDLPAIIHLLTECHLPVSDIEPVRQSFIVAEYEGKIIGCAGLETYGEAALFRSLTVNSN